MASPYPEHEKRAGVKAECQAIGEFLSWLLTEKGYFLAEYMDGEVYSVNQSINSLLAEHFGIDTEKLEEEQRLMLREVREAAE